jgi:hypothetical protein
VTDTLTHEEVVEPVEPEPDTRAARLRSERSREAWRRNVATGVRWLTAGLFGALVIVSAIGNQLRVQDADPMFMRVVVERVHAFGGSYYENAIHNKGPLEPFVYSMALHIGGAEGMWYVISIFMTIAALVLAWSVAKAATFTGGNRDVALAVAAVTFIHMTVSPSDYAGVLYARNMTIAIPAIAFVAVFEDRGWRTPRARVISTVIVGVALGIAVQTLTPEVFAGTAIATGGLLLLSRRAQGTELRRLQLLFVGSGAAAFLSAPIYYALRGSWNEFWSGWYVHARYMNIGTGRSLGGQAALGWDSFYTYYQHRPIALLVVLAFAVTTRWVWSSADFVRRTMHCVLLGWFVGAWIELIMSQRYSSHYFSVTTAPVALMGGVLAGYGYQAWAQRDRRGNTYWWPLAAAALAIWLSGASQFIDAVQRTSRFTSVHQTAVVDENNQGGAERTMRGVLDLVSETGDPLLAWTPDSYAYINTHRVSATRFIWKSFMLGEIYLGRTSPDYVLPDTWKWFAEDVEESDPVAHVEFAESPAPGTPYATLINDEFSPVYTDDQQKVFLRNDVARDVLDGTADGRWTRPDDEPLPQGWSVSGDSISYEGNGAGSDTVEIAQGNCYRLDGTMSTDDDALPGAVFALRDPTGKQEELRLTMDGDSAATGSELVEYYRIPTGIDPATRGDVPFSLIVGKRAAVVVVNDRIVAALRTSAPAAQLFLTARNSTLTLDDLRLGDPPALSGC